MIKTKKVTQEKLFDEHLKFIHETYGEDVSANYGWSQGELEFCTKIYSNPREYVTSYVDKSGDIVHEISTD